MNTSYFAIILIIIILSVLYFCKNPDHSEQFKSINKINIVTPDEFEPDEYFGYATKEPYPIDNVQEYTDEN